MIKLLPICVGASYFVNLIQKTKVGEETCDLKDLQAVLNHYLKQEQRIPKMEEMMRQVIAYHQIVNKYDFDTEFRRVYQEAQQRDSTFQSPVIPPFGLNKR